MGNYHLFRTRLIKHVQEGLVYGSVVVTMSVIPLVSQSMSGTFMSPTIQKTAFGCFLWVSSSCLQISSVYAMSLPGGLHAVITMRVFLRGILKTLKQALNWYKSNLFCRNIFLGDDDDTAMGTLLSVSPGHYMVSIWDDLPFKYTKMKPYIAMSQFQW